MERYTFMAYVTDALQLITENTSVPAAYYSEGKAGKSISRRWIDWDKPAPPEDTRTGDEIIKDIKAKADALREGGG